MFIRIATITAAALLSATSASAHHPGSIGNTGGAGPIITIPATTLEAGHVAVSFVSEYISLFGLNDADLIAAAARHEHVHSIRSIHSAGLGASFGFTNDLMVSIRLPYVTRTDIREGHHSHGPAGNTVDFRGDSAGIGDTTVLGQYRFFNNTASGTEAAVLFGTRLPTGRTDVRDRQGARFETEFQPGSGSVDPLLGLAFTQRFGAWSLDSNVLYVFATEGAQQTNLGDRFQYNTAVSYRLIGSALAPALTIAPVHLRTRPQGGAGHKHSHKHSHSHSHSHDQPAAPPPPQWIVDLALELNGEWHDNQVVAGIVDPNSGGNTVYLSPGLRVGYGNVSGFASIGVPVVNHMNGQQSKPDYRVVAGIAATF